MNRIVFKISQDGTVTEEVQGVIGNECEKITAEIEKKLGNVENRIHKTEYYQAQETVTDVTFQYNQDQDQG